MNTDNHTSLYPQLLYPFTQISTSSQIFTQVLILITKTMCSLLLLYPINVIIILGVMYSLYLSFLNKFTQANRQIYWPLSHCERYDVKLKNIKKDLRDLHNEASTALRKLEIRQKDQQGMIESESDNRDHSKQQIEQLITYSEQITVISDELRDQVENSAVGIVKQLQRYGK